MKNAFGGGSNRLFKAALISLVANLLLWAGFGHAIRAQKAMAPKPVEINLVTRPAQPKPKPKVALNPKPKPRAIKSPPKLKSKPVPPKPKPRALKPPPKPIKKPVAPRRDAPVKPNAPKPKPQPARPFTPSKAQPRMDAPQAPQTDKPLDKPSKPAPQGAHSKTLTAKNPAAPDAGFVKPGGNRDLGQPAPDQNFGEAKETSKDYIPPAPEPQPTQAPTPPAKPIPPTLDPTPIPPPPTPPPTPKPEPTSTPRPAPTPKPEPTATPRPKPTPTPRPQPTATPKPTGATKKARATRMVKPNIPAELRKSEFKGSVRVRVDIAADGTATPSIRAGSGNTQIDALALAALRKWRWKPALEEGQPVASSQNFRFDFEVN